MDTPGISFCEYRRKTAAFSGPDGNPSFGSPFALRGAHKLRNSF
jgi:hypothetical protein